MKGSKFIIILILLSILGTILVYNYLPDKIPGHFNFRGEVDRYDNKSSIIFTSLLPLGLYLLMTYLPKIDPKRNSYVKHRKAYEISKVVIILFMIVINWIVIMFSLGFNIDVGMVARILVGILFIAIGNFMSQIRHNYFFGIKTPWTLANETVWRKTHRVGAFSFIIGGLILIATSLTKGTLALVSFIAVMLIAVLYPMVYSYIEFRRITKE